jgi:hypothetical protein
MRQRGRIMIVLTPVGDQELVWRIHRLEKPRSSARAIRVRSRDGFAQTNSWGTFAP